MLFPITGNSFHSNSVTTLRTATSWAYVLYSDGPDINNITTIRNIVREKKSSTVHGKTVPFLANFIYFRCVPSMFSEECERCLALAYLWDILLRNVNSSDLRFIYDCQRKGLHI